MAAGRRSDVRRGNDCAIDGSGAVDAISASTASVLVWGGTTGIWASIRWLEGTVVADLVRIPDVTSSFHSLKDVPGKPIRVAERVFSTWRTADN